VGREIPGSPDLGATEITESSTMGELAFAIMRRQLTVVRDKEPGTRLGEDVEELHDMRVGTRRLRAALDLFAGVLPVRARVFREELGWLGRMLGAVRDLDVQLEGLAAMAEATAGWSAGTRPEDHDPLTELTELLERERETARAAMLGALDSVRWERLSKGLITMVQQGPARRSLAARTPAAIGLPELVEARHAAVVKAAKRAKKSGQVPDFHRLRIRCKRLRYALEFGSEVYGGRTARFVRQLTALQDELGAMQDAEVASIQLADLATGEARLPPATVFVMGGIAERHRHEVERLLRRLPKEVSRVDAKEWRSLRGLMESRRRAAEAALPPPRAALRAVPEPGPESGTEPEAGAAPRPASEAAPRFEPGSGPERAHPSVAPSAVPPGAPSGPRPTGTEREPATGSPGGGPGLTALAPPPAPLGEHE